MNPGQAVVLYMDAYSQIQALDRVKPSLPMKPGNARTMTHDYYKRTGDDAVRRLGVLPGRLERPLLRNRLSEP